MKLIADAGIEMKYHVGTMIEIPRAALTADEIAKEAEFFCFGTNDLTQMTFGFSRDDAGKFLDAYYDNEDLTSPIRSPSWIRTALASWCKMAAELGRKTRPNIKLRYLRRARRRSVLPSSSATRLASNYVSCSPFRVPIARLAAAQAAITK